MNPTKKFELWFPIKPQHVNQSFGVNGLYYQQHGINIIGHNGIDFAAGHGQPVYASCDGIARWEIDIDQGEGVVIVTNDEYDYKGQKVHFKVIFWHFCDGLKEPGFKCPIPRDGSNVPVKTGDVIGYADNTGFSNGTHLHFGLKPCVAGNADFSIGDPTDVPYWKNILQNNGYYGCIDPTPYFNGFYAKDVTVVIDNLEQQVSILTKIKNLLVQWFQKK